MIKLLDRYVARQFMTGFIALVLGLPILFIITDLTDHLDRYLARGLSARDVALSYVFIIPQYVVWAMPIAALVATVFTIGGMTRHQEISAAKAGGISFYRLIAPILGLAALLSVFGLGLNEVVSVANERRAEILGERTVRMGALRTNFVFQTDGGQTLSIRRLDPNAREMTGVILEQHRPGNQSTLHQTIERGQWNRRNGWDLQRGVVRVVDSAGEELAFSYSRARIPALTETPDELLAEPKDADLMRYHEITRFIRAVERSGGDARALRVEQAQKISVPMAVLVIVLFGAPLATSSKRGGTAYGVGVSLGITMVYMLLLRVGTAVGQSGALDPVLAAWLPNGVFLLAGLVLLARVRT
jgi:lipopolysaccharide export system permease protein